MKKINMTRSQARYFILAHQGLLPPRRFKGKAGIMEYVRHVGCIQYDPLNIVGYNQELVLQSRVSNFKPSLLQELLYKDRKLLDGWDKNMSIYSTEDWPYFSRIRQEARQLYGNSSRPVVSILPEVRREFEKRGPLSSADLDFNEAVDWAWAPTRLSRAVLESMYFWGELIIHHKSRTRKTYDLASRHIPETLLNATDPNLLEEQYHEWYVLRRIGSIGLLWNKPGDAWLGISGMKGSERSSAFQRLLDKGKIIEVSVEGFKQPLFMRAEDSPCLDKAAKGPEQIPETSIIAPLDNFIWERQLIKELFDFDYRWEVYKPVAERRYGYYVLPVLYGDRFIARFEPGRDKKTGALIIKNWWWETGVKKSKKMYSSVQRCFKQFSNYLGTDSILVESLPSNKETMEWLITANLL